MLDFLQKKFEDVRPKCLQEYHQYPDGSGGDLSGPGPDLDDPRVLLAQGLEVTAGGGQEVEESGGGLQHPLVPQPDAGPQQLQTQRAHAPLEAVCEGGVLLDSSEDLPLSGGREHRECLRGNQLRSLKKRNRERS